MINRVTLLGRLKEPVAFGDAADGGRYAVLTVTTWHRWVDRESGKRRQRSDDHTVLTFRRDLLGHLGRHGAAAGVPVYVEGALGTVRQAGTERMAVVLVHRDGAIRFLQPALSAGEEELLEDLAAGPG